LRKIRISSKKIWRRRPQNRYIAKSSSLEFSSALAIGIVIVVKIREKQITMTNCLMLFFTIKLLYNIFVELSSDENNNIFFKK